MKQLLFALFILLVTVVTARAQGGPSTVQQNAFSYTTTGTTFAKLGTPCGSGTQPPSPPGCANQTPGTIVYCQDCSTGANGVCVGGGTGILAKRLGGGWKCADVNVTGGGADITNYYGPVGITGGNPNGTDSITNVNINGIMNVRTFGAKGDGVTNDTTAIQAAITAAGTTHCLYFPAGTYVATSDLNLTSTSASARCVLGDSPATTEILCEDYNGNCIDFSGSDRYIVENISLQGGTSVTNAPKTLLFLTRTTGAGVGFGHTLSHVWTSSYGPYTVYDYGAEIGAWYDVRSNTPGVVISACNTAGIHSTYQTVVTGLTSMSVINSYGGNFNGGGAATHCAVTFDDACPSGEILDVNFFGPFFGEFQGGGKALCDVAGGTSALLANISVYQGRMEASDSNTSYKFIDFTHSSTSGLSVRQSTMGSSPVSAPSLDFTGQELDQSDLQLTTSVQPGVYAVSAGGAKGDEFRGFIPALLSPTIIYGNGGQNGNYISYNDSIDNGHLDAGGAYFNAPQNTLNGTTAGIIVWSQPGHGVAFKIMMLYFSGYQNNTAIAQSITFPQVFNNTPTIMGQAASCPTGLSFNGAIATLPVSMASPFTGQCVLGGS